MSPARRHSLSKKTTVTMAVLLSAALPAAYLSQASTASAAPDSGAQSASAPKPTIAYPHLKLPDASWATVYADGLAEVHQGNKVEIQHLPLQSANGDSAPSVDGVRKLPPVGQVMDDLVHGHQAPYAQQQVVVIYRDGVTAKPSVSVSAATLAGGARTTPTYTSDASLNRALAGLGVDQAKRLFAGSDYSRVVGLHAAAERAAGHPMLDFAHAYVLHLTTSSVPGAVAALRARGDVAYASPNWTVTTAHTAPQRLTKAQLAAAVAAANRMQSPAAANAAQQTGVPDNYALSSSAQALLNRPGVDAVPAYSQIADNDGQLPGQGETITNVSLGTLTDASTGDPSDPCYNYWVAYGPTSEIINGQRYLDWPSMPLIPTYTASSDGTLDPTGETCGDDPSLTEVGLDFSMMAPLPHDVQRPGHEGSGLTDLLGIAPGANYRLVLPSTPGGAVTDVDAAFLAAAMQTPRPNVITASLSFGLDQYGFAARFLEDDPMTQALLTAIVHAYHIVVTVSSNDGLRQFTNAAVSPAGGSVATQTARPGSKTSDINDVAFSDAVSRDYDSGSIDVGGSTLDDIFSAPPQDPRNKALKSVHAFPTTRFNGARNYSSGFGSRVNVSAPGDNVLSFSHTIGGDAQAVDVVVEGGTSASAPEVAATAAVVQQVARLTGNKKLASNPLEMRRYLEQTGTPLPAVPQADRDLHVGPQVDLGAAVTQLYNAAGKQATPSAPRVAVEQRQQASALGGSIRTATDPTNISLDGRLAYAWITISPDWVGLPDSGVTYRLKATQGPAKRLATTPWARLQPSEILAAAGMTLAGDQPRTVSLRYTASAGGQVLVSKKLSLTFGPTDGTTPAVLAPIVDQVTTGSTIQVSYNISNLSGATSPTLVVSQPGRIDPATGLYFRPAYTVALQDPTGTVDVPVSALQGGGIYGIGIQEAPGGWFETNLSAYAFTRVAPAPTAEQPPPPTLSVDGSTPAHYAEFGYDGSFQLHYDVRNVEGATGAVAEFSAPGPNTFNSYETFNNPGGSLRDDNGHDTGSVAFVPLPSTHGTVTLNGGELGLTPSMNHLVRVLPLRGGAAAGEASGVSSLEMLGVRPADGGSVTQGFGVNEHGNDGFVTSNQGTADGGYLGSVSTFAQNSASVTGVVASGGDFYSTVEEGCSGIFRGDVGLYDDWNPGTEKDTFQVVDPVANGSLAGTWTPPHRTGAVQCMAHNQGSSKAALLSGYGGTQPSLKVTNTNVAKNTFGKSLDLTPGFEGMGLVTFGGFGQDSSTGDAVLATNDAFNPDVPRIVVGNATTGDVSYFNGVTSGFVSGVGVDSADGLAAIGSYEGFGIYDLADQTGTLVTPGGSGYQHPGADATNGLFLVQEVAPPTFSGETPDNNATSSIVVTDTTGTLIERLSGFNFFNVYLSNAGDYVQANPATRTGFTLGPGGYELQPFTY